MGDAETQPKSLPDSKSQLDSKPQPDPQQVDALFNETRARLIAQRRTPLATYRVQLNKDFTFEHARQLVPYLARLGVSDLYTSPYLKATPGSMHGYDCIDHQTINPELGTEADHSALCETLKKHNMSQVLDYVPNHMGIDSGNALWLDVLENGASSIYATTFDIDWDPVKEELEDKVLLPILGDQYGVVLERGEFKLRFESGAFFVDYFNHAFPVSPRQYGHVLTLGMEAVEKRLGGDNPDFVELQSIVTAIEHLPHRTETDQKKRVERNREKEVVKRRLRELAERNEVVREEIERCVTEINGRVGDPRSFDRLDRILAHCSYRLSDWRVAGEEI
ncbi:MAG: alpha-amylase family glycosyl hydrolase, partial [Myxococcaceae bacterium]